jgi:hypothetical protein
MGRPPRPRKWLPNIQRFFMNFYGAAPKTVSG